MRKLGKKITAVILSFAMVLVMAPCSVWAVDNPRDVAFNVETEVLSWTGDKSKERYIIAAYDDEGTKIEEYTQAGINSFASFTKLEKGKTYSFSVTAEDVDNYGTYSETVYTGKYTIPYTVVWSQNFDQMVRYSINGEKNSGVYAAPGSAFTFSVAYESQIEESAGFAVKANGVALEKGADGSYTLSNIQSNQVITVEGLVSYCVVTYKLGDKTYSTRVYEGNDVNAMTYEDVLAEIKNAGGSFDTPEYQHFDSWSYSGSKYKENSKVATVGVGTKVITLTASFADNAPKIIGYTTKATANATVDTKSFDVYIGGNNLKYEWHRVKDGTDSIIAADDSKYSGQGTSKLTVNPVNNDTDNDCMHDGEKFYCVVSNSAGTVTTMTGELDVKHYSKTYRSDAEIHWYLCDACGEKFSSSKHADKDSNGFCDVCGYDLRIDTPEATIIEPKAGESPSSVAVVPEGAEYTAAVEWAVYDAADDEYVVMEPGEKFKGGKKYRAVVVFRANDGKCFKIESRENLVSSSAESLNRELITTTAKVNGTEVEAFVETDSILFAMVDYEVAEAPVTPDNPDAPVKPEGPGTGDDANLLLWMLLFAAAATGVGVTRRRDN